LTGKRKLAIPCPPNLETTMLERILTATKTLLVSAALVTSAQAQVSGDSIKVVYHMSEGVPQASRGLGNIRNHLAADPKAKIVVVAHGLGIDFLLQGAANQMDQPFAGTIADLANKGVEFRVCNNTLVSRKIDASKLVMEASVVPSGVHEVAKLQARESFVYLRP